MKPSPNSPPKQPDLLIFAAHPDDIEFGCGGIVARETRDNRRVHFVICSEGEAGTNGTPRKRVAEAKTAAKLLGATVEFIRLDGDALLELRASHARKLAALIRQHRPHTVLAPTLEQNQHPDHWRLGVLVRDATRLARYGGLRALRGAAPHTINQLFFYAVATEAEPPGVTPVLYDISTPPVLAAWKAAMSAHASQLRTRDYIFHQATRARAHGLRAGVDFAQPLFPNDPLVIRSLGTLSSRP